MENNSGRIFFNLLARTLATNLYTTLHRLIGLFKVPHFLGLFNFRYECNECGINFIKRALMIKDVKHKVAYLLTNQTPKFLIKMC